jgi:hypothetical protein
LRHRSPEGEGAHCDWTRWVTGDTQLSQFGNASMAGVDLEPKLFKRASDMYLKGDDFLKNPGQNLNERLNYRKHQKKLFTPVIQLFHHIVEIDSCCP